jgi:hypothetical protein
MVVLPGMFGNWEALGMAASGGIVAIARHCPNSITAPTRPFQSPILARFS